MISGIDGVIGEGGGGGEGYTWSGIESMGVLQLVAMR